MGANQKQHPFDDAKPPVKAPDKKEIETKESSLGRRALLKGVAFSAASMFTFGAVRNTPAFSHETDSDEIVPQIRGLEGQRTADLGNGKYLNPILSGDRSDPTFLKDGQDYYMTFSSFDYYPGIIIWHSRDLINWVPVGSALSKPLGSVFALDIAKHDGRYFIYIPVVNFTILPSGQFAPKGKLPLVEIFVIHADSMRGPWSDPIALKIPAIDPGHAVGEDGKRYLFLNEGRRVRLTDDGLATDGPVEKVYEGWKYPENWIVEGYTLEGPKILRRGDWFYMISAVGGTAGPPTSHMVIAARSRSIHGPWEDCPHNPIVHTQSISEPWWSRGHATIVEGPAGDWWLAYHGIENGYRTLGRQLLLEPVEWMPDGWLRAKGGDLGRPLLKPRGGKPGKSGRALSGDFSQDSLGTRFAMFAPGESDLNRISFDKGDMIVAAKGKNPADCNPLAAIVGDRRYEISVELELIGDAEGGLILFYSPRAYCGIGATADLFSFYSVEPSASLVPKGKGIGRKLRLKLVNDDNVVSFYHSADGQKWTLYRSAEVAGYNHNVFGGFLSLRPALYAAGKGVVRFRKLNYAAR